MKMKTAIENGVDSSLLATMISYDSKKVMSKKVHDDASVTILLMALSHAQSIPSHQTPVDVFLLAIEGEAILTIGHKLYDLHPGVQVTLPKEFPHAIKAKTDFKMMLVKGKKQS